MNPRTSYIVVGLFVIVLGTALVSIAIWLAAATEDKKYVTYMAYVYYSVSGLNTDAAVTYRGVEVGSVQAIELDRDSPERVRLLLDIEAGTPIKEDTVAILVTQGITGIANVELSGGSRDSPNLTIRGNQEYPEIQTGPSLLVRLDQAVSTVIDELSTTARAVTDVAERLQMLLDEENQLAIAGSLANVEQLTHSLVARANQLETTLNDANAIVRNTARASEEWPALMEDARGSVQALERAVNSVESAANGVYDAADTLNRTSLAAEEVIVEAGEDVSAFSHNTPAQIELLISEVSLLSESLRRLSMDLERDPNMLFFGRPEPGPGPGELRD